MYVNGEQVEQIFQGTFKHGYRGAPKMAECKLLVNQSEVMHRRWFVNG